MKRTTVAAASLLLLTGCAAPVAAPAPTVTATVTAAPEPTPEPAPTLDMVEWMDYQAPDWRDHGSTAELRSLGDMVCESLDVGVTLDEIGEVMVTEGLPVDVSAAIIVGSIEIICPDHQGAFDDWAAGA